MAPRWLQSEPAEEAGYDEQGAIQTVVEANGRVRRTETVPEIRFLMAPRWSPRGDALAFGTDQERTLVRLRHANGQRRSIETTAGEEVRWSPDGEWIAYPQGHRLLLSDTADPARTYELAADGRSPRWQP